MVPFYNFVLKSYHLLSCPNGVQWIIALDIWPLFGIHINILICGQPSDSSWGLT